MSKRYECRINKSLKYRLYESMINYDGIYERGYKLDEIYLYNERVLNTYTSVIDKRQYNYMLKRFPFKEV